MWLEAGETYDIDVWARDVAGNRGPVTTRRATVEDLDGCAATRPSPSALLVVLAALGSLRARRRR